MFIAGVDYMIYPAPLMQVVHYSHNYSHKKNLCIGLIYKQLYSGFLLQGGNKKSKRIRRECVLFEQGGLMSYSHLLVAVAPTPESQALLRKAVAIARPLNARVSLITLATDPEMYNQFAAPMMENLRELMHEETQQFLLSLAEAVDYPIWKTQIACGELGEHINAFSKKYQVDLVICGNHNQSFFSRATCSAKSVVGNSGVDVLLVTL